jgi:hypothetical protein
VNRVRAHHLDLRRQRQPDLDLRATEAVAARLENHQFAEDLAIDEQH